MRQREYPRRPNYAESLYVDYDNDCAAWCIFGLESGHAYASYGSREEAERRLPEMESSPEAIAKHLQSCAKQRKARRQRAYKL